MKFEFKYPNAKNWEEIFDLGYICYFDKKDECCICHEKTNWADLDFGTYICSEECLKVMNNDFSKAYNHQSCDHEQDGVRLNQPYSCYNCGNMNNYDMNLKYVNTYFDGLIKRHRFEILDDLCCGVCGSKLEILKIACEEDVNKYYKLRLMNIVTSINLN